MKALFLGTLATSQAAPIIRFLTTDLATELVDDGDPAQLAAALATADIVLTGTWRRTYPPAPRLRLVQVPLAGTDGIEVAALPRGVTVCNAYGHEAALGEFAVMMMLAWRHRLFDIATSFRAGSWFWSPTVGGPARGRPRLPCPGGEPHPARNARRRRAPLRLARARHDARRMRHRRAELRADPGNDGPDRRPPAGADETRCVPDQHSPRPGRRRGRLVSGAARRRHRRGGARYLVALSLASGARAAAVAPPVSRIAECHHDPALFAAHRRDDRAPLARGRAKPRPVRARRAAHQHRGHDLTRTQ